MNFIRVLYLTHDRGHLTDLIVRSPGQPPGLDIPAFATATGRLGTTEYPAPSRRWRLAGNSEMACSTKKKLLVSKVLRDEFDLSFNIMIRRVTTWAMASHPEE